MICFKILYNSKAKIPLLKRLRFKFFTSKCGRFQLPTCVDTLFIMQKGRVTKQQYAKGVKDPLIKVPNPITTDGKSTNYRLLEKFASTRSSCCISIMLMQKNIVNYENIDG